LYKISELLAMKKKLFEHGNVFKEGLVVAGYSLLKEL
jgi:hypothetical protein